MKHQNCNKTLSTLKLLRFFIHSHVIPICHDSSVNFPSNALKSARQKQRPRQPNHFSQPQKHNPRVPTPPSKKNPKITPVPSSSPKIIDLLIKWLKMRSLLAARLLRPAGHQLLASTTTTRTAASGSSSSSGSGKKDDSFLTATSGQYLDHLLAEWRKDPSSVPESWQAYFRDLAEGRPRMAQQASASIRVASMGQPDVPASLLGAQKLERESRVALCCVSRARRESNVEWMANRCLARCVVISSSNLVVLGLIT